MNALTKAFVVVVTILAVILVALVVPFAARVPDYAQQFRDLKAQHDAQLAQQSKDVLAARAEATAEGIKAEEKEKELIQIREEMKLLKSELNAEQAKVVDATATTSKATAALQVATQVIEAKDAQLAKNAELIQGQIGTLGELQGQIADLTQSIIGLRAENRRLGDNYLRIQEENKALVQQLAEADAAEKELKAQLAAHGIDLKDLEKVIPDPGRIEGSVVKIDEVSDGLTFVQLNVGTRDKVQEGMEFTVYRGDSFVGKIKIATVDVAESVGRLTLDTGVQVREGDAVRTGGR